MNIIREEDLSALVKKIVPELDPIPITLPLATVGIGADQRALLAEQITQRWGIAADALPEPGHDDTLISWVQSANIALGLHQLSVRDMFVDICTRHTGQVAFWLDDTPVGYEELRAAAMSLATGLQNAGVSKGDRVALLMDNRVEYIYSYFACFILGTLPVPLNGRWQQREMRNVLEDCTAKAIIFQDRMAGHSNTDIVQSLVHDGLPLTVRIIVGPHSAEGCVSFDALMALGEPDLAPIHGEDPAMISYTSGTTGMPKGVVTRNSDIVMISWTTCSNFGEPDAVALSIAPLYSAQGFMGLFENFARESTFRMLSTFNPNDILRQISTGKEQCLHTQPTMWSLILHAREMRFARFDALKHLVVSGSVCSPELARQIETELGCELLNAYGLVESCSIATMTRIGDSEDVRLNTVGRPVPGVEMKIVDEDRREIPRGSDVTGELALRGHLMCGYWNNPEKTAEVIDEQGWLYTGDLARWFDQENVTIVGRCKDMVIRGGFNVYPSDIEEQLLKLPGVQTAAVVGAPHPILGEKLVAFVVPLPGEQLTGGDIARAMRPLIADYKQPDEYHIVAQLPILLAGKIDKKELAGWVRDGVPRDQQVTFGPMGRGM